MTQTITDSEFLDRAHRRYAEKAALGYEQARACAEAAGTGYSGQPASTRRP